MNIDVDSKICLLWSCVNLSSPYNIQGFGSAAVECCVIGNPCSPYHIFGCNMSCIAARSLISEDLSITPPVTRHMESMVSRKLWLNLLDISQLWVTRAAGRELQNGLVMYAINRFWVGQKREESLFASCGMRSPLSICARKQSLWNLFRICLGKQLVKKRSMPAILYLALLIADWIWVERSSRLWNTKLRCKCSSTFLTVTSLKRQADGGGQRVVKFQRASLCDAISCQWLIFILTSMKDCIILYIIASIDIA